MHPTHEWIRTKMPVRITFNIDADDQWLRAGIRGDAFVAPTPQVVIVQGTQEAERVINRMANLKFQRRRPYGGAQSEAFRGF